MLQSNPVAVDLSGSPDPNGLVPADQVAKSVRRHEMDFVTCEDDQDFLDWRARRLDDDPALAAAWTRFFRDFAPLFEAIGRRGRRTALDSEDAAQEAWLVILAFFRRDRVCDDDGESRDRLTLVVENRLSNLKRRAVWKLEDSLDDEDASALVGREDDPAVAYERGRTRAMMRAALAEARGRISESSHRIVILRDIEGRTYAEIAEGLGMTVAQVRDRHRRAFPVLRALIIRRFGADPAGLLIVSPESDPRDLDREELTP